MSFALSAFDFLPRSENTADSALASAAFPGNVVTPVMAGPTQVIACQYDVMPCAINEPAVAELWAARPPVKAPWTRLRFAIAVTGSDDSDDKAACAYVTYALAHCDAPSAVDAG